MSKFCLIEYRELVVKELGENCKMGTLLKTCLKSTNEKLVFACYLMLSTNMLIKAKKNELPFNDGKWKIIAKKVRTSILTRFPSLSKFLKE